MDDRHAKKRVELKVPFPEKEEAKSVGARWDPTARTWYAPPGTNLNNFARWLPSDLAGSLEKVDQEGEKAGISLSTFLGRIGMAISRAAPNAEWIRAEISELRQKNQTLFLSLVERAPNGDLVASTRAVIWSKQANVIQDKFRQGTGGDLRPDIKILMRARAGFHIQYGFSLIIDDVDPVYTLGELQARIKEIRAQLKQEGTYDKNRALPAPLDFVNVVVISPEKAAGLGDFQREADLLDSLGLCRFRYLHAVFQGEAACASLSDSMTQAILEHERIPFDALVVIRGGGAVTDLAWLNDLDLARMLARAPMPVFTGIGHERDSTILDEVAQLRFDTPSKVANHIRNSILSSGQQAIIDLDSIRQHARRLLKAQSLDVHREIDVIRRGVGRQLVDANDHSQAKRESIRAFTLHTLHRAVEAIDVQRERAGGSCRSIMLTASQFLHETRGRISGQGALLLATSKRELTSLRQALVEQSRLSARIAQEKIEAMAQQIVGMGPEATLKRGFALVRDKTAKPITRKQLATKHADLQIEFSDGHLSVANREHK